MGQVALMQTQGAALESAVSMDKAEGLDPLVQGEKSGDSGTWCEAACVRTVLLCVQTVTELFCFVCALTCAADPPRAHRLTPSRHLNLVLFVLVTSAGGFLFGYVLPACRDLVLACCLYQQTVVGTPERAGLAGTTPAS